MKTWIKICATTCIEDALASIEAGADALGFVFAPSMRRVSPEQAQAIVAPLPANVGRVGVFQNHSVESIVEIVQQVGLTAVQLHGEETADFIAHLTSKLPRDRRIEIIKTVLINEDFAQRFAAASQDEIGVDAILLDSGAGSGRTFDWDAIRPLLSSRKRLIVAGGLSPQNVGDAIRKFEPWGVDVVSGVERGPGRKDPEKLKAFVAAVRKAEKS